MSVKSVVHQLHSGTGHKSTTTQSKFNNAMSNEHIFQVNTCESRTSRQSVLHNFYAYVDCITMHSGLNNASVMFQQAVPHTCLGDLHRGTSPQAHITSTKTGVGLVVSDTNIFTNRQTSSRDCNLLYDHSEPRVELIVSVRPHPQYVRGSISDVYHNQYFIDTEGIPRCRVQFTQYGFEDTDGNHVCLVFITNYENGASNWAFLGQGKHSYHFHVYQCTEISSGPIQIFNAVDMHVQWHYQHCTYGGGHTDPNIVYQNFKKDCVYFETLGVTYDEYILAIIDRLIDQSKYDMSENIDSRNMDRDPNVVLATNPVGSNNSINSDAINNLPLKLQGNFDIPEGDTNTEPHRDCAIPDKTRGFLFQDPGDFLFTGPDRDFVDINSIDMCIHIAEIIKSTGQPNYRQARFLISSGFNLQAWEHYLQHYPHRNLLQYLKFGFPLSIECPDDLCNTCIMNHHSATQYPDAVQQYLNSEIMHGAIIGPVDSVASTHFHCSPLLTRPKDMGKRWVILNLSYPYGNSLNDKVIKSQFDQIKFVLKFPLVDDIVKRIIRITM